MTVSRVAKGVRGPDLFVEILEGGDVIGRIAIECKQHTRWSRKFITKLKTDSEDADFAILSSSVMPATANGSRLHIDQGVIVAHPTLVPALVTILRKQIVESYRLKLTTEHRDEKGQQLLDYIGSSEAADIFDRLHEAADGLINLELKEVDTHHSVWRKRGELIRTVQQVHENLMATIDRIIGAGK